MDRDEGQNNFIDSVEFRLNLVSSVALDNLCGLCMEFSKHLRLLHGALIQKLELLLKMSI